MSCSIRADDGSLDSSVLPLYIKEGEWGVFNSRNVRRVVRTFWDKGEWNTSGRASIITRARTSSTRLLALAQACDIKWKHFEELVKTNNYDDIAVIFLNHAWWDELFNNSDEEERVALRERLEIPETSRP
jgi:hypothetical protein